MSIHQNLKILAFSFPVLFMTCLSSCRKESAAISKKAGIDSMGAQYFIKPQWQFTPGYSLTGTSRFLYKDGRIVKRSGGYPPPMVGVVLPISSDQLYENVSYGYEKAVIVNYDYISLTPHSQGFWILEMDKNKPRSRVSYRKNLATSEISTIDTCYYFYDDAGRLNRLERHNTVAPHSYVYTRNFQYQHDNLVAVQGIYQKKPNETFWTSEETFSMYDNKENPLRKLGLWDDLLYRSLSKNNFSKYTYIRKDIDGNTLEFKTLILPLNYDEQGNILYF